VQVELGVWCDDAILGGVVACCAARGIPILAHRPLGGERRRDRTDRDRVLRDLAARHGATPAEIALAALLEVSDLVTPLPGPTRPETASSIARAASIRLDEADRERLAGRFPAFRPRPEPPPPVAPAGEVVLVMGLAGAGKSTLAEARFVAQGFHRLNRDEAGGTLRGLVPALERARAEGTTRFVLDNTYLSRKSRAPVIDAARRLGLAVRCVHLATSVEDAQINAVTRLLARHGRLLAGDELRDAARREPGIFAPGTQFRMQRELEPPEPAEGFADVETVPFERRWPADYVNRAVFVWCDGILLRSRSGARSPVSADDLEVLEDRGPVLRAYRADGWRVIGLSWQPGIADGTRTPEDAEAMLSRMREQLDVDMDALYCPHGAGSPVCWCRKPLPGLAVQAIATHRLDPGRCLFVGDGSQDPGFARRLGFEYRAASAFFGNPQRTAYT
jgi:D-glycero-D-manno-heptose 1,7-bisphosphate phosphatase